MTRENNDNKDNRAKETFWVLKGQKTRYSYRKGKKQKRWKGDEKIEDRYGAECFFGECLPMTLDPKGLSLALLHLSFSLYNGDQL